MRSFKPLHFFSGEKNYKLGIADLTDRPKIYRRKYDDPLTHLDSSPIMASRDGWLVDSTIVYCRPDLPIASKRSVS
jgi:hypothetical protein